MGVYAFGHHHSFGIQRRDALSRFVKPSEVPSYVDIPTCIGIKILKCLWWRTIIIITVPIVSCKSIHLNSITEIGIFIKMVKQKKNWFQMENRKVTMF